MIQVAYTPNVINAAEPAVDDYPFAGGLFAMHGLQSSDSKREYAIQSEFVIGLSGPCSFADDFQTAIHKAIGYDVRVEYKGRQPYTVNKKSILLSMATY